MSAGPGLARMAGLGYLTMAVTSAFWFGTMQSLRSGGDAAVLGHIRDARLVFELSILAGTLGFIAYLGTAALLYRAYSAEAGVAVGLLFALVVASVPLSMAAIGRQMELLSLLDATGPAAQDPQTQVALLVRGFDSLMRLSSLFWGLWLFPLGWLAIRTGGLSRMVGAFLTLSGLGYLLGFAEPLLATSLALPPPAQTAIAGVSVLGELVATVWLLLGAGRRSA